jgi:FAD synthase
LVQDGWYCKAPHIYLRDIVLPQVSSTELREALRTGDVEKAKTLTSEGVVNCCIYEKLYV